MQIRLLSPYHELFKCNFRGSKSQPFVGVLRCLLAPFNLSKYCHFCWIFSKTAEGGVHKPRGQKQHFGNILAIFWLRFGYILATSWLHLEYILRTFWLHFGHFEPIYWLLSFWMVPNAPKSPKDTDSLKCDQNVNSFEANSNQSPKERH